MGNKTKGQILKTTDYKKFKFMSGNREVSPAHLAELRKSIKRLNLTEFKPVLVNKHMEIIDGQHSFLACKELEYPVYYCVGEGLGLEAVHVLNSSMSNWTGYDFLNMYVRRGNRHYKKLERYLERWHLPFWSSVNLLAGNKGDTGRQAPDFRDGNFTVHDEDYANQLAEKLHDFSAYVEAYRSRSFLVAFMKMYNLVSYDHQRMIKQLKLHGQKIPKLPSWLEYVNKLTEVYNYKHSQKELLKNMI